MCGILGASTEDVGKFNAALQLIKHRGPDYQSTFSSNGIMLGHARLAIIDLDKRSNQPFEYTFDNKKVLIVFNGEIYNFNDLKQILANKGYLFNTNSDTEVVCAAFLEWGVKCFDYFIGMWAVGILFNNNIILARDRNGKKPLYYCLSQFGEISFSSSLRSVKLLSKSESIDNKALELYFALGFIPSFYSIYSGIQKILPGEIIEFGKNSNGNYCISNRQISILNSISGSEKINLKASIQKSIERRLLSDVPVATLMSGGVDSTIVSYFVNQSSKNTIAYFVDFDDLKLSEKKNATYLANRNKINQKIIHLDKTKVLQDFSFYYKVFEEPFADYSGIPSISIFREAAKTHKVILTGDGGDELFFGYPHYFIKWILLKSYPFLNYIPKVTKKILPFWPKLFANGILSFESSYLSRHGVVSAFAKDFIDDKFSEIVFKSKSILRGLIEYDRTFNNLPEKYLVKIDRSSMAFGVEVRSPFMDEHLKELSKRVPLFLSFTPYSTKLLLKILFFNVFGVKYLFQKKKGFTPPIQELRDKFYTKDDFSNTKTYIKKINLPFFKQIENVQFVDLLNDKILFDRFFFFHNWLVNEENFDGFSKSSVC